MPSFLVVSLIAYVVSLPVLGALPAPEVIPGKSLRLTDVLFVTTACAFVVAGRARRLRLRLDLVVAAAAVVAAVALSTLAASRGDALLEIARTGYSMLVLVVLAHVRLDERERARVLDAWIVMAIVLAGLSLLAWAGALLFGLPRNSFAGGGSLNLGPSIIRVYGGMPPPTFAIYLLLAVAFLVHRVDVATGVVARLRLVPMLLLVVSAALTLSRAFAGVALTLAVLAQQRRGSTWLRPRRRGVTALAVVVVAAIMLATLWPIARVEPRDGSRVTIGLDPTANIYPMLHRAGVRMFLAQPVLGIGAGEFGRQWCAYTPAEERHGGGPLLRCEILWAPHSTWIGAASQGGVVLLGAWIGLYGCVLVRLLRPGVGGASLPRVAAAALTGLVVAGLSFDFAHVKFVWAFFGFALAAAAPEPARAQRPRNAGI